MVIFAGILKPEATQTKKCSLIYIPKIRDNTNDFWTSVISGCKMCIRDRLVTVGQEIEYVRSYLTIQKMRYKDKLEFEIKADPSITQVPIIRLVLQPLVENAIYHGLKYKDSKGLLTVHGYMKGENAVIDITDDGVGMDEETLKHIYDKHKVNYRSNGVGVYNVQQRLVLYYGKDYGIIYHSEKGKGTTASVVIPGIQEESHEKS